MASKNKAKETKAKTEDLENIIDNDFDGNVTELEFDGVDETSSDKKKNAKADAPKASSAETEEQLLYLKAEFDNFRKRVVKERSELIKYGPERLAVEVLSVLDIFEMALSQDVNSDNVESFKQGMDMTHNQLVGILGKFGIAEINPLGQVFDPNQHEALSNEPTDKYPEGHISQVFKKGYKFYEKMIRPAQVVVAVPATQATAAPEENGGE